MSSSDTDSLQTKLVLLVDDYDTHQYALGKHLRGAGFDVIYAQSGAETLKQATERLPDVIVLDIHLPDFDGFQACRELKVNFNTKRIPVVSIRLSTTRATPEHSQKRSVQSRFLVTR